MLSPCTRSFGMSWSGSSPSSAMDARTRATVRGVGRRRLTVATKRPSGASTRRASRTAEPASFTW